MQENKIPVVKIILNRQFSQSHVYIDDKEIFVTKIELEPVDGDRSIVKVKMEIMPDIIEINPELTEIIAKYYPNPDEPCTDQLHVFSQTKKYTHSKCNCGQEIAMTDVYGHVILHIDPKNAKII